MDTVSTSRRIVALVAVCLLAGPMAAHAAYTYTFSNAATNPTFSLSFTVADFVTVPGPLPTPINAGGFSFTQATAATLNESPGSFCFQFGTTGTILGSCGIFLGTGTAGFYNLFDSVPQSTGDFVAFSGSFVGNASLSYIESRYLTISEAPPVPLPAAAWLLFSGLGGLGFLGRRRKTA
jgi:hypothetical protein